jgi:hypothetical protein
MGNQENKTKAKSALQSNTQAIGISLVLAIIVSLICGAFAYDTVINYVGFALMLAGTGTLILALFASAATILKKRLNQTTPQQQQTRSSHVVYVSVLSIGIGVCLTIIGFMLTTTRYLLINNIGFQMLLGGSLVALVGIIGATLSVTQVKVSKPTTSQEQLYRLKMRRNQALIQASIVAGVMVTLAGSIIAHTYPKESIENFAGFGTLLVGVAILSVGISGTVARILKNRWKLAEYAVVEDKPHVMLGSIWAIGVGAMFVVNGSLIASSFDKTSYVNYAGFGMLLVGTGVFVYGLFVTAHLSTKSAMGYLSKRQNEKTTMRFEPKKLDPAQWLRATGKNLIKTSAVLNLAGAMFAVCLLFFSLWQLDMIVSGPVWWSSESMGMGTGWSHPNGAYASDYFQCFLWQTTVGQAYDTLFMLIFVSFIVLFASAFFWPRFHNKNKKD